MTNTLKVLISNNTGLPTTETLNIYIIGGIQDGKNEYYYSYQLDSNHIAQKGKDNQVYPIALSSLPVDADGNSYFFFEQSSNFSGRVWFSTSTDLITIKKLAANQPNPWDGKLFDFVELTITPNDNVNCDTTQVVGLGIPITMVNPSANKPFPPTPATASKYTYPDAVGIVPDQSLEKISANLQAFAASTGLDAFADCATSYANTTPGEKGTVNWLINPGYLVKAYDSSKAPKGMAIALDKAIYKFFNYYLNNTLDFVFKGIQFSGQTVKDHTIPKDASGTKYTALVFTDTNKNKYPIFYPYFNTNSTDTQGGDLNPGDGNTPPPPPAFWSSHGLDAKISATGQVLQCEGAFNDSNPHVTDTTILSALQNIVVSMLNRGLVPGKTMDNLIVCTGQLTLAVETTDFTDPTPQFENIKGAGRLYTIPNHIVPAGTPLDSITINSGKLKLQTGPKSYITQTISTVDGKITVSDVPGKPVNQCSRVTVQYASNQQVQLAFIYENANWPDKVKPVFEGPIKGTYKGAVSSSPKASFATLDDISKVKAGMDVFDINVQNPAKVVSTGPAQVNIESTIDGLLPSPTTDTLFFGHFFPQVNGVAKGQWNAYAAFLHYGGDSFDAPYISNQGYAFAYDDDGGYSSDITIYFEGNAAPTLGVYLGPLKESKTK